jgi:Asp-tRNA(Asn)/Glu-tRNA(Gln) amidotransferase C subunit
MKFGLKILKHFGFFKQIDTKLYASIDFLPIYNYFECSKGNLKYMAKLKDYDVDIEITDKFIEQFEKIEEEFSQMMNDNRTKEIKQKQARIFRMLKTKLDLENCMLLLAVRHDEDLAKLVRSLGFTYRATSNEDNEIRLEDLRRIKGEVENIKNKIIEMYAEMKEKTTENVKTTLFDIVAGIQKMVNVPIDVHKVPVAQFISYCKMIKTQN